MIKPYNEFDNFGFTHPDNIKKELSQMSDDDIIELWTEQYGMDHPLIEMILK